MSAFVRSYNGPPLVSPEWVTAGRADRHTNESVMGGWTSTVSPLMRGSTFTDFSEHQMSVPEGNSPEAVACRIHELTHARISPTQVPAQLMSQFGVSVEAVRLAEEVRVNMVSVGSALVHEKRGSGDDSVVEITKQAQFLTDGTERAIADKAVETSDWRTAVSLYLSTLNTVSNRTVKRRLRRRKEWQKPLEYIEKFMRKNGYLLDKKSPFIRNHHFSSLSYHVGRSRDTTPLNYSWRDSKTGREVTTQLPGGFIASNLPLAHAIDSMFSNNPSKSAQEQQQLANGEESPSGDKPDDYENGFSNWEVLHFGLTSLTETTSAFLGKRKRPAMVGKYPTRPDRLLTDPERRIFREVARSRGGVVVFDCSGSMSITHDEVHAVVRQFAGATVVAYTHRGSGRPNAWILADRGRMISANEFEEIDLGHGNGVDGPILRWALRNKRNPKDFVMWVSDGHVTGKNDGQRNEQLIEVARLSMRYNIIGAYNSTEAISILADMKRTGATPRNRFVARTQTTLRTMSFTGGRFSGRK